MSKDNLEIEVIAVLGNLMQINSTLIALAEDIKEPENQNNPKLIIIQQLLQQRRAQCELLFNSYASRLNPEYKSVAPISIPTISATMIQQEKMVVDIICYIGAYKNFKKATQKIDQAIGKHTLDMAASLQTLDKNMSELQPLLEASTSRKLIEAFLEQRTVLLQKMAVISSSLNDIMSLHDYTTTYPFRWFAKLLKQINELPDLKNEKFAEFIKFYHTQSLRPLPLPPKPTSSTLLTKSNSSSSSSVSDSSLAPLEVIREAQHDTSQNTHLLPPASREATPIECVATTSSPVSTSLPTLNSVESLKSQTSRSSVTTLSPPTQSGSVNFRSSSSFGAGKIWEEKNNTTPLSIAPTSTLASRPRGSVSLTASNLFIPMHSPTNLPPPPKKPSSEQSDSKTNGKNDGGLPRASVEISPQREESPTLTHAVVTRPVPKLKHPQKPPTSVKFNYAASSSSSPTTTVISKISLS